MNCTLTGECQQVLSAVSGNFSSPHYPNIYPNNINCHWSITLAAGYRIKLYFPTMDLEDRNSLSDECDYDSIAVYDGDSQADNLLGSWCGREQPSSLISKGNKLLVVLSTDRNKAHRGFTASYFGGKFSSCQTHCVIQTCIITSKLGRFRFKSCNSYTFQSKFNLSKYGLKCIKCKRLISFFFWYSSGTCKRQLHKIRIHHIDTPAIFTSVGP